MRQPRIVPWIDAQEWSQIYHELYGSHELQQHAVMRIKAWLSRGRVPVAIESTSNLVEISLSDHSPTEKRLLLSMALIRFVNGIVDQGQRGGFAASALVVAHDLGLPSWLVELRHQATHDKLPSLVLLESARVHALDWLHQNYWQVQENAEQTLKQSLNELLLQYNDARAHAAFSDKPDVNTNDVLDRLKMAVTLDTCHLLVKILVDELDTQCGSELGTANLSTWEPLLTCCECTWPEFSVMLTNKLIEKLQNNAADTVGAESAAAWVRHISVKYLSPMAKYVAGPMCQRLLLHPHHTSVKLAEYLCNQCPQIPEKVKGLIEYQLSADNETESQNDNVVDADTLVKEAWDRVSQLGRGRDIPGAKAAKRWDLALDWEACPIGMLPGNRIPNLTLDASFDLLDVKSAPSDMVDIDSADETPIQTPRPNIVLF